MKSSKWYIEPFTNSFLLDSSHYIQNYISLSRISNTQKLFGKKIYLNLERDALKIDTPTIYITLIDWLVGSLLMAQIFCHV